MRRILPLLLLLSCRTLGEAPPRTPPPRTPPPPAEPPAAEVRAPLPPPLQREFRAAWVSPVWGGEWPSRQGMSTAAQQAELTRMLDRARNAGLNAVVLHVRPASDALYASTRAPWSAYLTGVLGRAPEPFWDPLQFAVTQAHVRGLELHAWFNPFRASPPDLKVQPVAGSVLRDHPNWIVHYGRQVWQDPGLPEVRRAAIADILEVVERYDIDGVHLDDYFYPYREERTVRAKVKRNGRTRTVTRTETIPFPDDASWQRYGVPAGFEKRADWRRSNIDDFVQSLYAAVRARKPWLPVGISPFGIWRPGSPAGITGLDAYAEIYADARRWLREGWVDYLAPQLYWPIAGSQSRFTRLDAWWREENVLGRHIWPGLQTEQEASRHDGWPAGEVVHQVDTLRAVRTGTDESLGHIHFRLAALAPASQGGLGELLRGDVYAEPAWTPATPWLGGNAPATPRLEQVGASDSTVTLSALPGDTVPVRWWVVQVRGPLGWREPSIHFRNGLPLTVSSPPSPQWVAVRGLSRTGIAGEPALLRLH